MMTEQPGSGPGPLDFRLLGPLEVLDGQGPVSIGGPKPRAVLALLLLSANRVVGQRALLDEVWDDDLGAEPQALQVVVSRLRRLLAEHGGPDGPTIRHRPPGYELCVAPDALDLTRFAAEVRAGRSARERGDDVEAARLLHCALGRWRGPALADLDDFAFARAEAGRLEEQRLAALEDRVAADLALGAGQALVEDLEELVAEHPIRELLNEQLVIALYRAGRQADALAAYARLRHAMVERLGLEPPPALQRLQQIILEQRPLPDDARGGRHRPLRPAVPVRAEPPSNLPHPLTSFVGREAQLHELTRTLDRARLVTLVGAGGCGKTRLAIEGARQARSTFPDGVWLVELASLLDPALTPQVVANALGIIEQAHRPLTETIAATLSERRALLVLDNCEHLLDATAALAETLLHACPALHVLATSREPLGVTGEAAVLVPSLQVPDAEASGEQVAASESGRLFVERAQRVAPGFAVDAANAPAIGAVCRDLDGIPLAIELAVARLRTLSLPDLKDRLSDRFALLTGGSRTDLPRHRTLRAAVEWSYDLLDAGNRMLHERLSVFAGGFTLEAAEVVCADSSMGRSSLPREEVLDRLSALVDKSLVTLVRTDPTAPARYRLLETLRQYAAARLADSGDEAAVRSAHARYFRDLAEQALPEIMGPDQQHWISKLETDHDNIRRSLGWALEADEAEVALRLAGAMWPHWWRHGHIPEGSRLVTRVVDRFCDGGPGDALAPLRAGVLVGAGYLFWKLGAFQRAHGYGERACALFAAEGIAPGVAAAQLVLGMLVRELGDDDEAAALLEQALAGYEAVGDAWGSAATRNCMVSLARDHDDFIRASALLAESTPAFKQIGDTWGIAWSLWLSGRVALRLGQVEEAAAALRESTVLARDLHHGFGVVLGIAGLAGTAAAEERFGRAARLLGATDRIEQTLGFPVRAIERDDFDRDLAIVRATMDPDEFAIAWADGQSLTTDQAIAEALAEDAG